MKERRGKSHAIGFKRTLRSTTWWQEVTCYGIGWDFRGRVRNPKVSSENEYSGPDRNLKKREEKYKGKVALF